MKKLKSIIDFDFIQMKLIYFFIFKGKPFKKEPKSLRLMDQFLSPKQEKAHVFAHKIFKLEI